MGCAPWLTGDAQAIAAQLISSYRKGFRRPLVTGLPGDANGEQWAQALFAAPIAVLAHDGSPLDQGEGPRLIYANRAALSLFGLRWAEMAGMPSKLTAEPAERSSRLIALTAAQQQTALSGYRGIRIDRHGRRFQINNAQLWTLLGPAGESWGQGACFSSWWWL
jgi:PAS domain-containing protein